MKTKIIFSLLLLLATLCDGNAQSPEPFSYNAEFSPSVESYSISRFGNVSPSLYTGSMSWSLPLYTYKDEDFELPLSLEYNFDGYRPYVHSGLVGYGWTLCYGGTITREVRGYPDDWTESDTEGYYEGYAKTVSDNILNQTASTYELASGQIAGTIFCGESASERSLVNIFADSPAYRESEAVFNASSTQYDPNPDIFHYHFMGYSGSFMMNSDGVMEVFGSSCPKGEVNVEYDFSSSGGLPESSIVITLGNGYRYTFGGEISSMEYSIPTATDAHATVVAWRLRRIDAPNGNYVEFIHHSVLSNDLRVTRSYTPTLHPQNGDVFYRYSTVDKLETVVNTFYPLPHKVTVNGEVVYEFDIQDSSYNENDVDCFTEESNVSPSYGYGSNYSTHSKVLKSITVKNYDGAELDLIRLDHRYVRNSSSRMLLQGVQGCFGSYSFEYESLNPPFNDTESIDHWGFYNGRAQQSLPLILNYGNGSLYSQFISGVNCKDPMFYYSKQGALRKIIYPTGGYTEIDYESHDASSYIDKSFGFYPDLASKDQLPLDVSIGGVRVSSISNVSGNTNNVVKYTYRHSADSSRSSGILMNMPLYAIRLGYIMRVDDIAVNNLYMTSTAFTSESGSFLPNDSYMSYSAVQEHYPDGSYTEYEFHSYIDKYDWYDYDFTLSRSHSKTFSHEDDGIWCDDGDSSYPERIKKFILPPCRDYSKCRGKLNSKTEYDSTGTARRSVSYIYDDIAECQRSMYYNTILDFTEQVLFLYSPRLIAEYETVYENDRSIVRSVYYQYNERGQVQSVTHDADSVSRIYRYRYFIDQNPLSDNMSLRSAIVNMVELVEDDGTDYLLSNVSYQYDSLSLNDNPTKVIRYDSRIPAICENVNSTFSIPDGYFTRIYDYMYDSSKFRLLEAIFPGGRSIKYSWDADKRHIISKEENSPENISHYEWKDQVGLVKITMPTSQYKIYQYDSRHRLSEEIDHSGAHVSSYRYHLNNE